MKVIKSVSFDLKTFDLVNDFMIENKMKNFSQAVNILIQQSLRFQKIALTLQKKLDENQIKNKKSDD